mgnify:CR=1 FL=1
MLPGVREPEGPFGENTGAYFSNDSPVIEVTAVTHRRQPIYPGLTPWAADVDMLLWLAAGTLSLVALAAAGWRVETVWECELKDAEALQGLEPRVAQFIETQLVQGDRYRGSYPRDDALAHFARIWQYRNGNWQIVFDEIVPRRVKR